jgi:Holliday junction resolvase RusA-like endonuclease
MIIKIDHNIEPMKRPRVSNGHAWSPSSKQVDSLAWEIKQQTNNTKFKNPVYIFITLGKCQNKKGDLDNILKTILDAIVKTGMIKDDSQKYVASLSIYGYDKWRHETSTYISIGEVKHGI